MFLSLPEHFLITCSTKTTIAKIIGHKSSKMSANYSDNTGSLSFLCNINWFNFGHAVQIMA